MPAKFAIYSKDATDPSDPTTASDYTYLDQDPAEYDPEFAPMADRGMKIQTLGGAVRQDFGVNVKDRQIVFRDDDGLSQTTKDALQTKYETKDTLWYFTDGHKVWDVQFSRSPQGFRAWRNQLLWRRGIQISQPPPADYVVYSYEIILDIVQVVV